MTGEDGFDPRFSAERLRGVPLVRMGKVDIERPETFFKGRWAEALLAVGKPLMLCTIYDAIPGLGEAERAALALFNDVIIRSAVEGRVPVIDLRIVCDQPEDYSDISPIEPSGHGGAKIARVIADVVAQHDFSLGRGGTYIFTGTTARS